MHFLTSIIAALRLACFAGFAGAALIFGATAAIAESSGKSEYLEKDVELDVLIEAIDDYGQWRQHEIYGDVWIPRVDEDWRPYTLGQWAHDDAAGWTWVSEEPFGWVVYHYGRWSQSDELGWFWVPGTKWAPAWVAWRESDEHIGWAPLPPEPPEYTGPPYEHTVIYDEPRYEAFWVFATYALFARPHIHRHVIWHRHRHYRGIYRKSRRGHHARWRHRRIVNRGISLRELRKRARRHVRPAHVVVTDRAHGKRRRSAHGLVHVYRPSPGTKPRRPRRDVHEGRRFYNADDRRAVRQRAWARRAVLREQQQERRRLERRQSDTEGARKRQVAAPEKRAGRGAEALRRRAQQKRHEAAKQRARQQERSKARDTAARKAQVEQKARAQRKAQARSKARAQRKAQAQRMAKIQRKAKTQRKARAQRRAAASRKVQRRAVQKRKARAQRSVRRKAASRPRARTSRARARPRAQARQRAARPQKARSRGGQRRR